MNIKKYFISAVSLLLGVAYLCACNIQIDSNANSESDSPVNDNYVIVNASDVFETKTYSVENFSTIYTSSVIDVKYVQNPSVTGGTVKVYAPENILPYVDVAVKNGTLSINLKNRANGASHSFNGNVSITCTVTSANISKINYNGVGNFSSNEINSDNLTISSSGTSNISINNVNAKVISLEIAGTGGISISNLVATDLNINAGGVANIQLPDIKAVNTTVNTYGTGSANLAGTTENCDYNVSGVFNVNASKFIVDNGTVQFSGTGSLDATIKNVISQVATGTGSVTINK